MSGDAAVSNRPGQSGAGVPGGFDINAETYPFAVVQRLLDQAAYFNLFSIPDTGRAAAITAPGRDSVLTGLRIREILCRFGVQIEEPRTGRPLAATNLIGDPLGRFEHRWMIIPDDYHARPDRTVPPSVLDATRSQRFVMLDARCTFGSSDGFLGFGTGTTYPVVHDNRRELLAAAVGTVLEGYGRFRGHEGTYTYCGSLSPETGFRGNLMLRVMDARGDFRTAASAGRPRHGSSLEAGETYVVFRGEKTGPSQRTTFRRDASGRVIGLNVSQQLRALDLDAMLGLSSRLDSRMDVGPEIGRMAAEIRFELESQAGLLTPLAPAPFQSLNRYTFTDREGRTVGALVADGREGRTFSLQFAAAPGQTGLRFGGFGPIVAGSEGLEYATGLMTDNSVVGLAPHVLATAYVLRLDDPDGRFRAT